MKVYTFLRLMCLGWSCSSHNLLNELMQLPPPVDGAGMKVYNFLLRLMGLGWSSIVIVSLPHNFLNELMFTYQSTEPKALLCVVQLKSDLHDRRSQSSDTLEFRVLLLLLLLLTTLHNNIIAAHTIQPHLATELKALLNRWSSHNFLIEHIYHLITFSAPFSFPVV